MPAFVTSNHRSASRALAAALEPTIGQVYFAPEAHAAYQALGFNDSPATFDGLAMPDGAAYFTSRGSLMGQVAPMAIAATFAVFNPTAVIPAVEYGWSLTDAATIRTARARAGADQLRRVLGDVPLADVESAATLLSATLSSMRPEGRSLFAGALYFYDEPSDPWARYFALGDIVREYRGDSHTAAWIAAGVDATEISLLSERYMGIPARSYARTRAWSDEQFDAAVDRLQTRGWFDVNADLTDAGRAGREAIEAATDAQMAPVLASIGNDVDAFIRLIEPWGAAVRAAKGYPASAVDLWPNR